MRDHSLPVEPTPWYVELVKQTALIGSAVLFYFAVRGQTEGAEQAAVENGRWILEREGDIGLDIELSVQEWTDGPLLTTLSNWVYIWLHWPVIIGTLLWLHHDRIASYLILRNALFISGAIGLVIFVSLPVAPPRLIDQGFVDTVTEYSHSYRVFQPPGLVNKYAAMPSLHVGWNLIVGIVLFQSTRSTALRAFAVMSPILMAVAVVATGNHYLVDGIVGSVVALIGLWMAHRVTLPLVVIDRRIRRRVSL